LSLSSNRVCAILLCAGSGTRMNSDTTKQRLVIGSMSVVKRCALAFEACSRIDGIVVVAKSDEIDFVKSELSGIQKLCTVVKGGSTRSESARKGFESVPEGFGYIAIHDVARCLIKPEDITRVVEKARETGAATAVSSVTDTVKIVDDDGIIRQTVDRNTVYRATTPQIFSIELYKKAISKSYDGIEITDDNMLVEMCGADVYTVDIGSENIKITTKGDLEYAEFLLKKRGVY